MPEMLENLPYLRNLTLRLNNICKDITTIELLSYGLKKCAK